MGTVVTHTSQGYCLCCQIALWTFDQAMCWREDITLSFNSRETKASSGLGEMEEMLKNTGSFVTETLFQALVLSVILYCSVITT